MCILTTGFPFPSLSSLCSIFYCTSVICSNSVYILDFCQLCSYMYNRYLLPAYSLFLILYMVDTKEQNLVYRSQIYQSFSFILNSELYFLFLRTTVFMFLIQKLLNIYNSIKFSLIIFRFLHLKIVFTFEVIIYFLQNFKNFTLHI